LSLGEVLKGRGIPDYVKRLVGKVHESLLIEENLQEIRNALRISDQNILLPNRNFYIVRSKRIAGERKVVDRLIFRIDPNTLFQMIYYQEVKDGKYTNPVVIPNYTYTLNSRTENWDEPVFPKDISFFRLPMKNTIEDIMNGHIPLNSVLEDIGFLPIRHSLRKLKILEDPRYIKEEHGVFIKNDQGQLSIEHFKFAGCGVEIDLDSKEIVNRFVNPEFEKKDKTSELLTYFHIHPDSRVHSLLLSFGDLAYLAEHKLNSEMLLSFGGSVRLFILKKLFRTKRQREKVYREYRRLFEGKDSKKKVETSKKLDILSKYFFIVDVGKVNRKGEYEANIDEEYQNLRISNRNKYPREVVFGTVLGGGQKYFIDLVKNIKRILHQEQ